MVDISNSYVEPGVYFQIANQIIPNIQTGDLAAVFIGKGIVTRPYIYNNSNGIEINSDGKYIIPIGMVGGGTSTNNKLIKLVFKDGNKTTEITNLSDWTITIAADNITITPPSGWSSGNKLVYAEGRCNKSNDDLLRLCSSKDQVVMWFGDYRIDSADPSNPIFYCTDPTELSSDVQGESLAFAAELYFGTNYNVKAYFLQTNKYDNSNLTDNDVLSLLADVNPYCIVFLKSPTTDNLAALKNHVETMSNITNRKNRIAIVTLGKDTDNKDDKDSSIQAYITAATTLNSRRMVLIAPSSYTYSYTDSSGNSIDITLPAHWAAVEFSAKICNNDYSAGEPLTGKPLVFFKGAYDIYNRTQKNTLAANGICVLEQTPIGSPYIRHALTTATGNIVDAELKMTRLEDMLSIYTLLPLLDSTFIHGPNGVARATPLTLLSIRDTVLNVLNSWINKNDIVSRDNVQVIQNNLDPRQVDVSFRIRPSWDVDWIKVTFGIYL